MTLTEIENLKYIDCANILYKRLFNIDDDKIYVSVVDTDLPDYERLVMEEGAIKPTEEQFLAELNQYKTELIAEYNIAEQAKIDERQRRLTTIKSFFAKDNYVCTIYNNNEWVSNAKYFANITLEEQLPSPLKDFSEEDESLLVSLETIIQNRETEIEAQKQDEIAKEAAKLTINKCNSVFEYVVKYNQTQYLLGNIDDAGLDVLETQWTDIVSALHNFRPKKAHDLIANLDLTGTIYTEKEREEILALLE